MIPSSGHLFFVADLARPALADEDTHHAERVLRIRSGEEVSVGDGVGGWRRCRFGVDLEPITEVIVEPPPAWPITVAFALTKGAKPEWVIEKLTEVGVDRVAGFVGDRSIVRWDDSKTGRAVTRWRAVARGAAMQSRRAWLPEVLGVVALGSLVASGELSGETAGASAPALVRADRDGPPLGAHSRTVLIGPEGGWSESERAGVPASVSLGPTVLRAETAAVVAGAVLADLRWRSGASPSGRSIESSTEQGDPGT